MKARYIIALSTLIGVVIGAAAIQTLHAQAKSPVYAIALNQLTNAEGYAKDYGPKGRAAILAHGGVYVAAGKGTVITGDAPHDQATNQIGQKYAHYNISAVDGVKQ